MAAVPEAVALAVTERRLGLRVPVDRSVRVSAGWRTRRATLIQLSLTGCRLQSEIPVSATDRLLAVTVTTPDIHCESGNTATTRW